MGWAVRGWAAWGWAAWGWAGEGWQGAMVVAAACSDHSSGAKGRFRQQRSRCARPHRPPTRSNNHRPHSRCARVVNADQRGRCPRRIPAAVCVLKAIGVLIGALLAPVPQALCATAAAAVIIATASEGHVNGGGGRGAGGARVGQLTTRPQPHATASQDTCSAVCVRATRCTMHPPNRRRGAGGECHVTPILPR